MSRRDESRGRICATRRARRHLRRIRRVRRYTSAAVDGQFSHRDETAVPVMDETERLAADAARELAKPTIVGVGETRIRARPRVTRFAPRERVSACGERR